MTIAKTKVSRRGFVGGSAALSASAVLGGLFAGPMVKTAAASASAIATKPHNAYPAFAYHCSLVHKAMSDKLTRIVADPNISAADTSKALRTTFCPCCSTQINASYPVVPWSQLAKAYG